MKAAWYERNGPARNVLEVGETPTPQPAAGEVRVRVHASGVNPSDVKGRAGRPLIGPRVIPHSDGAGDIDAVGAGVSRSRIGERVWLWNGQWRRTSGTAAEYICVPEAQAVRLPEHVDYATGACFGIPALTALHAVNRLEKLPGKTLLIIGAGSSVAHYALQVAKARGARVLGTASPARAARARAAGADFVIDYKSKDVAKVVKDLTAGKGVDGIIDMDFASTADLLSQGVLAAHGKCVSYGSNYAGDIALSFPAMLWNSLTLEVFLVYELQEEARARAIDQLTALLASNALKHDVAARFRLDEIAKAHEAVEGGQAVGNVIVDIV